MFGEEQALAQESTLLVDELRLLRDQFSSLRTRERQLEIRQAALGRIYQVRGGSKLAQHLSAQLPDHLVPGNVGDVGKVAWNFAYPFDFNFGLNPTYSQATQQEQQVQVTQESAFLITAISISFIEDSPASSRAPLQLDIRDNQSTRQLNNLPIVLQSLGAQGNPTLLDTAFLMLPNASLSLRVTSFVPANETNPTVGDGRFQIALLGVRMRTDDFGTVLQQTLAPRLS